VAATIYETGEHLHSLAPLLAAAQAGTLTGRTDADTGQITATLSGHGISAGHLLDVFWASQAMYRYGMSATAVSGLVISVNGGSGSDLPALSTAVTFARASSAAYAFDGDDARFLCVTATRRGLVKFRDSGGAALLVQEVGATAPFVWSETQTPTHPITGNPVATIEYTNADSAGSNQLRVRILHD